MRLALRWWALAAILLVPLAVSARGPLSALPDPAAAKAADKCQKSIAKAGAKFTTKTLKGLEKCYDALFKCIQTKPGEQKCLDKALAKCAKEVNLKAPKERAKLASAIGKKCESFADLTNTDGLGYDALALACQEDHGVALTDVTSVAACVEAQHECQVERLFTFEMVRAGQIAGTLPVPLRGGSCLEDLGGMGDVGDPKGLGKALDRCQAQVKKAGAKFVATKLKSLQRCVTTIFGCLQKKPGDPKCAAKAQKTCDKEIGEKILKAEAKLTSALDKRCLDIFAALGAGNAMNTDALGPACQILGVAGLATLDDLAQCLMRKHECVVEDLFRFAAPRADTLLQTVGHTLSSGFCVTPTPTPTTTATPTPTVTPTATVTATPTPTATFTPAPGEFLLAVTKVGDGTGTVTLQPSGNICGTDCAVSVAAGAQVMLEAATANGDDTFFQGFDDPPCFDARRDCSITVNEHIHLDARFTAQTYNPVFISSGTYNANRGGATAYDQECNDLATAAGINNLSGDAFVAWMSDSSSDAVTRLGNARGFVRIDGRPFADAVADLTAGAILNPLYVDENGVELRAQFVMTGTEPDGTAGANHCSDWTDPGSSLYVGGVASYGPEEWTAFSSGTVCSLGRHIYCLGTTKSAALSLPPAAGKLIYMTNQPFIPGNDPDAQCEADKPAGTGTVAALLARTTQRAFQLLDNDTTYVRPDGQIVATGQKLISVAGGGGLLDNAIWQTGDGTYGAFRVWSGANDMTTLPVANTCTDWTSNAGGDLGILNATSARTNQGYWSPGNISCGATSVRVYCVEQ